MMEKLALRRFLVASVLILVLFNFLVASSANAAIVGDVTVKVSPGQIPPYNNTATHNDYLGNLTQASSGCNNDTIVKCEYPKGMILQQTFGDLLFSITVLSTKRTIAIYIPPEFGVSRGSSYVWSSITNDYRFISLSTLSSRDPIAPSWFRVQIRNGTSSINPGSHFIRLFNVTAPSIVGLYFFKAFIDGNSIGAKNFPILVVSADPNPAYISGTVIHCRSSYGYGSGYGDPLSLNCPDGGKVVAEGLTVDGRSVVGQAFFSASDDGRYTIYGLAAGTYNLTAYASGYLPTPMLRLVQVRPGQSLNGVDLCVYPCPVIEGIVMSKCSKMPVNWTAIANRTGPEFGAALVYVGNITLGGGCVGGDLIYALRGANTSDFLKYDTLTNQWRYVSPTPGPVGAGGSLAFDIENQFIYALQGGRSDALWAYDVANDQWSSEALFQDIGAPAPIAEGGSIVFNSAKGLLYVLRGGGTTGFYYYLPGQNLTNIGPTPDLVGAGGGIVFNEADDNLYALRGNGTHVFWRYNLPPDSPTGTWETLSPTPIAISAGGSLTFNTQDGFIYAFAGDALGTFMKYDRVTDSWSTSPPASVPSSVGPGGSLTFDTSNGFIYALNGSALPYNYSSFLNYNYLNDSWSTLADFPKVYPRPITIEILDSIDNSMRLIQDFTDPLKDNYTFTYDGSTLLDGHIPQDGSGYIAGILLVPYNVRVWVNEYLQPQDMIVDLTNNPGEVRVVFDVERSGRADILLHFKDSAQGQVIPVTLPLRVSVGLYDRDGILRGQNYTLVEPGKNSANVIVTGFLGTLHDYGLPAGTYQVVVTVDGFFQYYDFYLTIYDCALTSVSFDVIRAGSLRLSVRSVNCQSPAQPRNWLYNDANIRVELLDQYQGLVYKTSASRQRNIISTADFFITGLRAGTYIIRVYTFGYFQKNISLVEIADGITSDRTVDVVIGGAVDVDILLFKEDLPIHAGETYPFSSTRVPFRVELYDAQDQFMAANATYIPADATTFSLRLNGFRNYAGNPALRWVNYYDAPAGGSRTEYGLPPGSYWAVVYLPGFSQGKIVEMVTVPACGRSSIVIELNRLAHLSGDVTSLNMFGESVPLNWAIVDAIGSETKDFAPTLDGHYDMWLPDGQYLLICSLAGYNPVSLALSLSKGSDTKIDFRLNSISIAVPEFNSNLGYLSTLVIGVCVASLLLRRSRSKYGRA
jgi:hypothetical protein